MQRPSTCRVQRAGHGTSSGPWCPHPHKLIPRYGIHALNMHENPCFLKELYIYIHGGFFPYLHLLEGMNHTCAAQHLWSVNALKKKSHLRCFTKSPVRLVLTYDYHLHAQVLEDEKRYQRGALSPFDGCETWENQRRFNSWCLVRCIKW